MQMAAARGRSDVGKSPEEIENARRATPAEAASSAPSASDARREKWRTPIDFVITEEGLRAVRFRN